MRLRMLTGKSHKACQQVCEILDLTEDDAEGSVVIQNLCDVINLDDSGYASDDENDNELVNNSIKQLFPRLFLVSNVLFALK